MTALSEALVAAQRQAIAALSKQYIAASEPDLSELVEALDGIGCTDKVEQNHLTTALDYLRQLGAQAPEPTKPPVAENEPASESQLKYLRDLADRKAAVLPDYTPTKANASKIIDQLNAGTYNPDEWTVPF